MAGPDALIPGPHEGSSGIGLIWYAATLVGAFIWMMGSPALTARLSFGELVAASLVVGTIAPAYITYLCSCLLSMLE
jgi:hypothetical protein